MCEEELSRGRFPGQKKAIALSRRLPYLPLTPEARRGCDVYLSERLIPDSKPLDAIQLALASVHRIDYLLTWNYAHLANAQTQARLAAINLRHEWRTPPLVSPESIPFASMHQEIERTDDE